MSDTEAPHPARQEAPAGAKDVGAHEKNPDAEEVAHKVLEDPGLEGGRHSC
jgi:hypothetical protein